MYTENLSINYEHIGNVIQNRRHELGYSQSDIAEKVKCSTTHFCRIEAGGRVSLELLHAISSVLGINFNDYFTDYTPENPYLKDLKELFASCTAFEQQFLFRLCKEIHSYAQFQRESLMFASIPFAKETAPAFLAAETPDTYDAEFKASLKKHHKEYQEKGRSDTAVSQTSKDMPFLHPFDDPFTDETE